MVLLLKVQRSSQQAVYHRVGSDALLALKPEKQEIAGVDSGHYCVIGLEAPADSESLIRQS